tara:strand:- start:68 stop:694 length:627 start_codon:yes stop_codon:yes gene_type:complete
MLQQKTLKEKIIALTPGEFHKINESTLVYSKESSNEDLTKVFIKNTTKENQAREFFVFAEKAYVEVTAQETINLNNGTIFFFDELDEFSKLSFEEMKFKVELESNNLKNEEDPNSSESSNTTWLLSLCVMTIISVFLAVPLSSASPREGRYKRVLPALLLFSLYLGLLIASRGVTDLSSLNQITSMIFIHLTFLIIAFYLYFRTDQRA